MNLAVSLAETVYGQTGANPPVGAVIVKNGRVIGIGAHLKEGENHAERAALKACTESPKGADIYVTLEPCSHHGKTPPCTDALIEAGIKRVFYASCDHNSKVDGLKVLKAHGIEVILLQHPKIFELYRPFNIKLKQDRPFITLKTAMTLDGKIARENGDSYWVSNEQSRKDVHLLRSIHDGILIGGNTLLKDNPHLTVRISAIDKEIRPVILLGSKLLSSELNIFEHPLKPIVFTTNKDNLKFSNEFQIYYGEYELDKILKICLEEGIHSLLVEGGSTILTSFLNNNLFDDLIIYIAPKIFGYSEYQIHQAKEVTVDNLILHKVEKLESDIKLTYRRTRQCSQD